jgi:alanyl-tRNA synthetase
MDSAEIRTRFLRYFADRGHQMVPSASLLLDDPTLLFVNAGMVPFKPYFLGEVPPPYGTATSVQKCVRTLDIDEVGKTTRHASFFQMAGNFSFGDYFKERAIPYAWELLTSSTADGGFGFAEDRLWVTVYTDDDEAAEIWHRDVGMPKDRIQRRGQIDNFWSMGVPGPCGPCSEIYYDRGPRYGPDGGPIVDEDRFLEVWNLVFMQFERGEGAAKEGYPILGELPAKNIDTGMGLERMAALLQGVDNIYEIDTTMAILQRASDLTGVRYGTDERSDVGLRVIADHSRTCAFLIGDGVLPGNEGRGYVLRRLMRRVIRTMRLLGCEEPSITSLMQASILAMAPQYPELNDEARRIESVAEQEEGIFSQTLRTGTQIFDVAAQEIQDRGGRELSGEQAFALHDTYGFPIELTLEMAREADLDVDEAGFARLMGEQRERAKADARSRKSGVTPVTVYREILDSGGTTTFTGYDEVDTEARVTGLLRDGAVVDAVVEGDYVEVVMDRSPFYAEAGGQLGDHGMLQTPDGAVLEVFDVQSPVPGLFVHRASVSSGEVNTGSQIMGRVDTERRRAISRAHTATHMVHRSFREILGETATQMGSENAPGRFRFDFPSASAVPESVLGDVEARVNEMLIADLDVTAREMAIDEARNFGAMALFGEKYGDRVRVVSVGDWAHELCGGTHAQRSGQLGVVTFLSEGSIGAGVRRVEALVGVDAYQHLAREHILVNRLASLAKVPAEELPERMETLMTRLKDAERELQRIKTAQLTSNVEGVIGEGRDVGDFRVWCYRAPEGTDAGDLRELALRARGTVRPDRGVAMIGAAVADGRVALVSVVNERCRELGLTAKEVLDAALTAVEGRGGGKDDIAQGGGTRVDGVDRAFDDVIALVTQRAEGR